MNEEEILLDNLLNIINGIDWEKIINYIKNFQKRNAKAIEELNQPWGLADYEDSQKEFEHKKKVISILQGEEVK